MNDPAAASIEERLASSKLEDVYDAILDVGKQGRRDLVERVVPYLLSPRAPLREAALRTLVLHLRLADHKDVAIDLLICDPDERVREAAAMGLAYFAMDDRALLACLVDAALESTESNGVRAVAFLAALDAAGIEPGELPKERAVPDFENRANWSLFATVLQRAGMPIAPPLARRLAPPPTMPLTGDAARAHMDEVGAEVQKRRASRLAAAKRHAARRGKEPFDLVKLETMCDTTHAGRLAPLEERQAEFEWMYYTFHPNVMTLAEFARHVDELNRW